MSPSSELEGGRSFSFGPFRLQKAKKQLTEDGTPVRLGSRALDLLLVLVEHPSEVLSRRQLEAHVWPRTIVEETSLRVHIAALRRALRDGIDGARYITNIPGRGYCFVAPVRVHADPLQPAAAIAIAANRAFNNLPPRLTEVLGRKDVTAGLGEHLRLRRFVSIAGPGGIGKTTVALAVAAEHIADYEHGAVFVDLAPLAAPGLVPTTVALALGCQPTGGSVLPQICNFLRDRHLLLVLDNCEHVLGAVAHLVESVMRHAPDVRILTTTREPLLAEGEWVYRLAALDAPGEGDELTHEQALKYPAIRLFVERAEASSDGFALSDETLPAVRQLCRRLDGIPLAIELAAARVASLGVGGLAQRLDDLFQLLNRGRRTAMPRHQTLQALLDWSFDLLTAREQVVLRRLSVFRSAFNLQAAVSVATSAGIEESTVVDCVSSLTLKSLIHVNTTGSDSLYRLLDMTRAYAARKLVDSGESGSVRRRHADHFLAVAKSSTARWGSNTPERVASYGAVIDDLRAAIEWAFSADGDDQIAVAITAAAWVATVGLGLFDELRARVDQALERARAIAPRQPELELALCVCWCFMSGQTPGIDRAQQVRMFDRVRALAVEVGDAERHAEALYAMCVGSLGQGRYPVVKELMVELQALVRGEIEPLSVLVGDRLLVLAHHHLGDHSQARALARRVLAFDVQPRHAWYVGQVPRSVSMGIVEARILWLEGASDRATESARQVVENALGEHPFALSQALALAAIPVALWRGDHARAQELTEALRKHAVRHSLAYWQTWAGNYARFLDPGQAAHVMGDGDDQAWTSSPLELDMLATLSPDLLTPAAVERVRTGLVAWCGPEVLRAQAIRLARSGAGAAGQAEELFLHGLEVARGQSALAWELRIATSLASFWPRNRLPEAHALLSETLARISEGHGTRDVLQARRALAQLDALLQTSSEQARA